MRNIKLIIEYKGTNYHGWQRQKNTHQTIQEIVERALAGILQEKIRLTASGRTDAGVHAAYQVVNFKTYKKIAPEKIKQALNSLLPADIVVLDSREVDSGFHARFDARSKIYRYIILNRKYPSALLREFVYFLPHKLDIKLMQEAARLLVGRHDFRAFQAADKKIRNSVRKIKKIKIYDAGGFISFHQVSPGNSKIKKSSGFIFIDIEADSFIYKMVRNIVGTLIEIGKKKQPPISIREVLISKDRRSAGATVPAQGLCLLRVKY